MKPLLMDLYELTMAAGYFKYRRRMRATFDLFIRNIPKQRNYFVFAGLGDVINYLDTLNFKREDIDYLDSLGLFHKDFLKYLKNFKFTGDVWALPEGTVFFPEEPVIRITAPLIEAQIVESFLLNTVNLQTTLATKASRIVYSAQKRAVYDFSLRRTQGKDAAIQAARCSYIGGCAGTSNVLAGKMYNIPVVGTMAHSFIMSFNNELESFRSFAEIFPKNTILLIDTYDQWKGLKNAIIIAKEMEKKGAKLLGIRLDSGDMAQTSKRMRQILDNENLHYVQILASGNLNEYKITDILKKGAKVDSFGVGTHMGTSSDAPYSDVVYKIAEVTDNKQVFVPTMKFSIGKVTLPGRKEILRRYDKKGKFKEDLLVLSGERIKNADTLLIRVMQKGKVKYNTPKIQDIRKYCLENVSRLPDKYKLLDHVTKYPVSISPRLKEFIYRIKYRVGLKSKLDLSNF